jgi:deoxyribodipyrimidine photolyase-related protein
MQIPPACRHLNLIFGDQLNLTSLIFEGFDKQRDCVLMAEVKAANLQPPSHKQRSLVFLSAMRHFARSLQEGGFPLVYLPLSKGIETFVDALQQVCEISRPASIRCVLPGEYAVLQTLRRFCDAQQIPLELLPDNHFIALPGEFTQWSAGKRQWRMEYWYRHLRKRTGILMDGSKPVGGDWNYDKENRGHFGKQGPGLLEPALVFEADDISQQVQQDVAEYFPHNPGNLTHVGWPVTRDQSLQLLEFFIQHQLPLFGEFQDAMWTHEPWLYHSRLSVAMNLKLLSPIEVIRRAEQAYSAGQAPLNAVEGFVRQILGWREYVRGLYWTLMPDWLDMNALDAHHNLPEFYWTGEVDMQCLHQSLGQVLKWGYGHHIQRLMVTGLFAQLWQTQPKQIHQWYLAMYVDAVEWVELPNVLGMSQFADGGLMASKPYIATGKYIKTMSNYCDHCCYKPEESDTETACPFTTLYWHFLEKHQSLFANHPRLGLQVKHLHNMTAEKRAAISHRVEQLRWQYPAKDYS